MKFQEIDANGIIKVERCTTATFPSSAVAYDGRLIFDTTTDKLYYGIGTEWVEIGDSEIIINLITESISAHEMSTNHPSASTLVNGFVKTQLPDDAEYFYNGVGDWTRISTDATNIQISGTWVIGDVLRIDTGGTYVKANATTEVNAEVAGIVSGTTSTLVTNGYVSGLDIKYGSLVTGSVYFLSTTDGDLTTVAPTAVGYISKPLMIAISDSEGIFINWRGFIIPDSGSTTPTVPPGTIIAWPTNTVPDGYLECFGAGYDTTSYADLFAAIGYTYGGSAGTFYTPDYRGTFLRALDNGRGLDAGRSIGTYQADTIESHTHSYNASGYYGMWWGVEGYTTVDQGVVGSTTGATGGTETRPKNYAVKYIIKY